MRVAIVFIVCVVLSVFSYIYLDRELAQYFEKNTTDIMYKVFRAITKLGQSEIYIIAGLAILLYKRKTITPLKVKAKVVLLSVIYSGIAVIILKFIFARYRPDKYLYENLYGFNWFEYGYIVNSFPSGHSATIMSAFSAFAYFFPKYFWLFITLGFVVALSRVGLYAHFLSDVIMGCFVGYLATYVLYTKYIKKSDAL